MASLLVSLSPAHSSSRFSHTKTRRHQARPSHSFVPLCLRVSSPRSDGIASRLAQPAVVTPPLTRGVSRMPSPLAPPSRWDDASDPSPATGRRHSACTTAHRTVPFAWNTVSDGSRRANAPQDSAHGTEYSHMNFTLLCWGKTTFLLPYSNIGG